MLDTGQQASEFELPNHDGEPVQLAGYEGNVVLYFYPKADTPGCTREACSFRDSWNRFEERNIAVVGVSTDSVSDIEAFKEKHDLPFELLSDEDGDVAAAYESYDETNDSARRNTYVIDENGVIERVYENVTPDSHAEEIVDDLVEQHSE